jgi:stromal membrane-associated protein
MSRAQEDKQQAIYRAALDKLLQDPTNKICSDCHSAGPRWASPKLGIFICMKCAGIHRGLGVHISFVRSVTLDKWKESEVDDMSPGNALAACIFEGSLPKNFPRPSTDSIALEKFIRNKYVYKRYLAPKLDTNDPIGSYKRQYGCSVSNQEQAVTQQVSQPPAQEQPRYQPQYTQKPVLTPQIFNEEPLPPPSAHKNLLGINMIGNTFPTTPQSNPANSFTNFNLHQNPTPQTPQATQPVQPAQPPAFQFPATQQEVAKSNILEMLSTTQPVQQQQTFPQFQQFPTAQYGYQGAYGAVGGGNAFFPQQGVQGWGYPQQQHDNGFEILNKIQTISQERSANWY